MDGAVGRRAQRLEHESDLILLDEAADHLHRLGRAVLVVEGDVVDLAPVDPALVVDLLEVGAEGFADGAVGRGGPAVGVGVANLDLGGGDPHDRLGGHAANARQGNHSERHQQRQEPLGSIHGLLPFRLIVTSAS